MRPATGIPWPPPLQTTFARQGSSQTGLVTRESIIQYLQFLRDKSLTGQIKEGLLRSWFTFPEVKQNWLGYSKVGNIGSGLSTGFAQSLHGNLHTIFSSFGNESITMNSHLEKLCLIESGVGRDKISDFTTNLIKDFLLVVRKL